MAQWMPSAISEIDEIFDDGVEENAITQREWERAESDIKKVFIPCPAIEVMLCVRIELDVHEHCSDHFTRVLFLEMSSCVDLIIFFQMCLRLAFCSFSEWV